MEQLHQRPEQYVKPALGCTEPVSLALACAIAVGYLTGEIDRIDAWVSPNLMKNGIGVTVPSTGMKDLSIAADLTAIAGDANAGLVVLKKATHENIS
ncbi:hypothetical protein ACH07K_004626 [Salmonella enterica]|uniref:hypothetical protein n=1 Tax=Enterobacteriaceae TaxID=543 RepID=UPI001656CC6D|nr:MULTISPECIES: hypothetical protein [Enterobacteriaceae]MCG9391163.1 hypothetical protein [Escherichia coli]MCG9457190.1 hypothetical protein [Escherichia coli]MCG9476226.1 hypothetical protein [Escherichia coli]